MKRPVIFAMMLLSMFLAVDMVEAKAPDNAIEIDVIQKKQPSVTFRHKAHKTIGCKMCHHADTKGPRRRCSGCHGEEASGNKVGLKEAFHRMCMGCHKKAKRGPIVCTRCHRHLITR